MMTARWVILGATLASLAAAGLSGCTQATEESGDYGTVEQGILNGQLAGNAYAAVGAITFSSGPDTFVACSGTLIGPKAVLTARHCATAIQNAMASQVRVNFAIGQLAYQPDQNIGISSVTSAPASPSHPGLLFDGGRDVGVAYLRRAPIGVTPAKLGEFTNAMVGTQFKIVGFGRNNNNFSGLRYIGPATARSLGGTWYPLLFNNQFGQFLNWYFTDAATSNPTMDEAFGWWDAFELEPGFELLAGGLEGEALGCFGDSGGPLLLGDSPDNLTVYGVDFAGEADKSTICTRGAAYVVHNEEILDFINGAL